MNTPHLHAISFPCIHILNRAIRYARWEPTGLFVLCVYFWTVFRATLTNDWVPATWYHNQSDYCPVAFRGMTPTRLKWSDSGMLDVNLFASDWLWCIIANLHNRQKVLSAYTVGNFSHDDMACGIDRPRAGITIITTSLALARDWSSSETMVCWHGITSGPLWLVIYWMNCRSVIHSRIYKERDP